ncbi:MAG TPA: MFS transporter [Methylomirabilota bacterium]|nr:MFS transporter [Methylomirabilota bacterium]
MAASAPAAPAGRRWLMWGIPAVIFLIAFLHRAAPGVFAKELMQAFSLTGTAVGLLSAMYFYSYAGFMVPGGVLIDSVGPRWVIALGGAVMGMGSLAMGLAPSPAVLFAGRLLVGLGAAVTFTGALKIAANWFPPSQFGMMSAVTATVGVLGALAGSAPLAALVASVTWRGALVVIGAVTLAASLLCGVIVRDRPAPAGAGQRGGSLADVLRGTRQVLGNPHTWPPFLCFFFLYAAMGNFFLWSVPFLRDVYGLALTTAALYSSLPSVALLVTAPLTGYLSDRVLHRRKLPYTLLAAGQFLVWLVFLLTLGTLPLSGVCLLFLLLGVMGGAFVLTWPLGAEVNPPALAGSAVAVTNLGGFVGAALTQGPVGAVLDAAWTGALIDGARAYPVASYRGAFTICTLFVLAGAAISLLLKETRGENVYHRLRADSEPGVTRGRGTPRSSR